MCSSHLAVEGRGLAGGACSGHSGLPGMWQRSTEGAQWGCLQTCAQHLSPNLSFFIYKMGVHTSLEDAWEDPRRGVQKALQGDTVNGKNATYFHWQHPYQAGGCCHQLQAAALIIPLCTALSPGLLPREPPGSTFRLADLRKDFENSVPNLRKSGHEQERGPTRC